MSNLKQLRTGPEAPWRQWFRAATIVYAQTARLAPDRGLVSGTHSGQYHLYAWDVPTGALRQLTYRPEGTVFGAISPDGRWVYYLHDNNGDEMGHFVRVPYEGGNPEDITPSMPPYSAFGLTISRSGNMLGFTASDATGFHTLVLPVNGAGVGPPREIHHSRKMMFGPTFSHNAEISVVVSTDRATLQHNSLLAFETATGKPIGELWDGPGTSVMSAGFAPLPGDTRLLVTSSRGGMQRPAIWNVRTGERTDLSLPPIEGDVTPTEWSPHARRILLSHSHQAVQRLAMYDIATRDLKWLDAPEGSIGFGTYFRSNDEIFAMWQDASHPPSLIALDANTGRQTRTVLSAGKTPLGHPWQSISFRSSDGQEIQGWLGLPDGAGPFPTILHTHGGPETQTNNMFLPASQVWMDHGFAYLAINYRGSTGFGRAFREKIWGNIGHWEIEDMVAARHWLVQQGIADPARILLTGWSYGGYLTCLALGKTPDLWAGGMAGTATVDWEMEFDDLSPALRGYSVALLGGTPQEKPQVYAAASALTYAASIKAPLLVMQGRNDTRTPARPVEVFEARLKALGKPIDVHWFDEGHMGGGVDQDLHHMELMLRFAYGVVAHDDDSLAPVT